MDVYIRLMTVIVVDGASHPLLCLSPEVLAINPRLGGKGYGQRFLFVNASEDNTPPGELRVVLNWSEELKRLAPPAKKP